jgi:large subunit ribosomal protein L2
MTMRYTGGGHKQRYRIIDFQTYKEEFLRQKSIEYDPNRTAFIALVMLMVRKRILLLKTD